MKILKRLNHNAALCLDSKGREAVVLGAGVGFPGAGDELDVSQIERTFYGLDARYLALIDEIPLGIVDFAGQMADIIRAQLPYELSANYPLALADHISFALRRIAEHIDVPMPMDYDLPHLHPVEWKLAESVVSRIESAYSVRLPAGEIDGIVLGMLASAERPSTNLDAAIDFEALLDTAAHRIEQCLSISIDRSSLSFARFATHLRYLLSGREGLDASEMGESSMLDALKQSKPEIVQCARAVASILGRAIRIDLHNEEIVYLSLHIDRLLRSTKGGGNPGA